MPSHTKPVINRFVRTSKTAGSRTSIAAISRNTAKGPWVRLKTYPTYGFERPKEADGSRFGDFETDTVIGAGLFGGCSNNNGAKNGLYDDKKIADPYCSGQKGAIENGNKPIRQYIPKKASFKDYSDENIEKSRYKLNRSPREKLDFNSSKNGFYKYLV